MSDDFKVHALVTTRPDSDLAIEHKKLIQDKLAELCVLMDAAQKDGFFTQIQLGKDFANRNMVQQLILAKHF